MLLYLLVLKLPLIQLQNQRITLYAHLTIPVGFSNSIWSLPSVAAMQ
jgi:hypothetical protein